MKKILFRKILFDYMSFFLIALISTSVIVWVFQAVNFLDIMIEDGRDYLIYLNYSLLNFPKTFSKLFPFILFFSIFYVTTKIELNNELIILWNFGVNKIELINFIFKASLILLFIQLIFTSILVPKSQELARSFLRTSEVNFYGNFIKTQKFNDTIKGVTIYSDKKDKDGNLYNLYLKKDINKDEFKITYARKGIFKKINGIPILVLLDGTTITGSENEITNFSFSKSDFSLKNLKSNTTTYPKNQEISSLKLIKCIKNIKNLKNNIFNDTIKEIENCNIQNIENLFKELYKRFIIPIYIPLLSIAPFLLILSSKEKSNYTKYRMFTFILGLIIIIFSETTIRLVTEEFLQNLSLLILPFIFILILYINFTKKFNGRKI
tara:strand:- start:2632 stop:3768 length:1137 start_codon:yes stop_codon:yes gene_type:complete